jgi:short-subunit dehydrogenase
VEYRTALITGASAGLGEALATRLAQAGVEVCLAARREEELRRVADLVAESGGQARVYPLDVRDPEAVVDTLQRADDELGGIDLVVANAGVGVSRWSGKLRWEHVRPVVEVNVVGASATLVALLPRMVERGRGHVVGMSSLARHRGFSRVASYCGSKAYLANFLESLRVDLHGTGVTVTEIRPGYVRTDMTDQGRGHWPFLVEVDYAAESILDAIMAKKAVHEFPLRAALVLRVASHLPNAVYDGLVRRLRRRR